MSELLSSQQKSIIAIGAFAASGELEQLKTSLTQGLESGLSINQLKALLEQMYAYAGFPRSLNALGTLMTLINERKQQGIQDEEGRSASPFPTDRDILDLGTENQTQLIGQKVTGPLFDFSPEADRFLKAHLFGDIFQNDILTWQERELATIAALANISGVNPQLLAHMNISLNNDISREQLAAFVEVLRKVCGDKIADNAADVLQQVTTTAK